ncbi:tumor necrosis factor receptor superfamily member 14-like isoform X2 [Salvelinus fontinalis]|uniref:tumor necrosis factor receptor superfamily member 14-like isoform X2 n=1 Tax=Salvelinus fontinalis TaxID=8038 RepID=UPI0024868FCE|nr:tumor necrosis factor receptor superfamily member 14-like isoform X2 [Salvelinus fontinalis]
MVYLSSAQYFLIGLNFMHVFGSNCGPAEYKKSDGQCCPMCGRGLVVRRDCTVDSSTSCIPCIRGTFMNEANGLTKCFPCSPCDPGQGLFTQAECKPTSNTVCDVPDGFYCRSYSSNSECSFAVEHTHCSPGQSTKSPGTKTTDTMCEECQHGFYSQHGVNCTAWTDCAAMGHVKTKDGNSSQDVICNKVPPRSHVAIIAPILLLGLTVTVLFCFYLARAKRKKELYRFSESGNSRKCAW